MRTRLVAFAGLSLVAMGVGIAAILRDVYVLEASSLADYGTDLALYGFDVVLILLAAANLRLAQFGYLALFGAGVFARVQALGDVMKLQDPFVPLIVIAFIVQIAAVALLLVEIRAQRSAERIGLTA